MTTLDSGRTVGELVAERPSRARVFERFGIDYCCGGRKPIAEACAARGIAPDEVVAALHELDRSESASTEDNWLARPLAELADHIVATHHTVLREELPRISRMLERVATVHGEGHPEMRACRDVFAAFADELSSHMGKEEMILFPMIRAMEAGETQAARHCGGVSNPIRVMEAEHENAGGALSTMRELTGGFLPPPDACNTYRVLLDALARLEADMHTHVHKENSILFPRAMRLEQAMASQRT